MEKDNLDVNIVIKNKKIINKKKDIELILKYIKNKKKKEINEIDKLINITKFNLLIEQQKLDELTLKNKKIIYPEIECKICYVNKINLVIIPCGHVFCRKCLQTQNVCPYCRTKINNIQKLYFY